MLQEQRNANDAESAADNTAAGYTTRLTERLGALAFRFRSAGDDAERAKIARAYAETVDRLIASGDWNEVPAPEDQLPDDYMPEQFYRYFKTLDRQDSGD